MKKYIVGKDCVEMIPFLGIILMIPIVGLILIIFGMNIILTTNEKSKEYVETTGYYKDKIYSHTNEEGTTLYNLEYEYTINGEQYTIRTDYVTNIIPKIGAEKTIKYNPQNPSEAVMTGMNTASIVLIIGIAFLIIPCFWIIPLLKNKTIKNKDNDFDIKTNDNDDDNYDPIKNK